MPPISASSFLIIEIFIIFSNYLFQLHDAKQFSFSFPEFTPNTKHVNFEGDAFLSPKVLQLTRNQADANLTGSAGRATYDKPVRIYDKKKGKLADFTAHFSFIIKAIDPDNYGDGISFFLAPLDSDIPANSSDGLLALFSNASAFESSKNPILAVEFDSFNNSWDPERDHVGINVNSIKSVTYVKWNSSIKDGRTANAWVSYASSTRNLSVYLTYAENPSFDDDSTLFYIVDLRQILPEWVRIGFSASTGSKVVETHKIRSWNFTSNMEIGRPDHKGLIIGLVTGFAVLVCGLVSFWLILKKLKRYYLDRKEEFDLAMDDEFEKGTGPKRFTYRELSRATNAFSEAGKLGEGGFGGVYKGLLSDSITQVAVKRVSRGSKQGKKEYVSEVRIISRLRHRNLVQLLGWCHEQGQFLLVYEYMPNGSLDSHLFGGKTPLTWGTRYRVALGLASGLLYLHEEWEQCVVHRDIKSSNIMLDCNFNAKLGDFGLARLVDHELGSQTTVLAGTMGYLAPECVTTGKASKESDVYSFGVVALEISCGRKPVDNRAEPSKVRLVEWVWDLYGKNQLLEAVDKRLHGEFSERETECLMTVGLWCCHPDHNLRPSIKQVINVLNFEAPVPPLPAKLPVPMYYAPPISLCKFSYTSTGLTDSEKGQGQQCSCTSCTTNSSASTTGGSNKSLLAQDKGKMGN